MDKQQRILQDLQEKLSDYYFYIPPTAVPSGAVAYVYDLVDILRENGYKAHILHDKEFQTPMWMGGNYHNLPHVQFEQLKIKASDFLFIPEVYVQPFFSDMKQNNIQLPCEVVVLSQVQDLILHSLDMGAQWYHFGVRNVITTTNAQKEYINRLMVGLHTDVVTPYIHDEFKPSDKPQKPIVLVHTRDAKKGEKLINEFTRLHPHYAWVPSKSLSKMDRGAYANHMRECCLAVWVDDISSFGTFPLECMKSGVPVIGKVPDMMPEWMGEEVDGQYKINSNGTWVLSSHTKLSDLVSLFMDRWLTDTLDEKVYEDMAETAANYTREHTKEQTLKVFKGLTERRIERINTIFEKQNKAKENNNNLLKLEK